MKATVLVLLLAACASPQKPMPPAVNCPGPIAVPRSIPRIRTPKMIGELEVRVELAREAERRRGDQCAEAVGTLQNWIEEQR